MTAQPTWKTIHARIWMNVVFAVDRALHRVHAIVMARSRIRGMTAMTNASMMPTMTASVMNSKQRVVRMLQLVTTALQQRTMTVLARVLMSAVSVVVVASLQELAIATGTCQKQDMTAKESASVIRMAMEFATTWKRQVVRMRWPATTTNRLRMRTVRVFIQRSF